MLEANQKDGDDDDSPSPLDYLKFETEGESPFAGEFLCDLISSNHIDSEYYYNEAPFSEVWKKYTFDRAKYKSSKRNG